MITFRLLVQRQGALTTNDPLSMLSNCIEYQDYILLPLILFASIIVCNRGSIYPRRDPYAYKLFERPQQNLFSPRITSRTSKRNVAEEIKATNAELVIFWGSQSGVAEGFAQRIAHEFTHRFKRTALVADLSDFDPKTVALIPRGQPAIFIMSTYGEGDPSDNALEFVAWVNQSESACSLENLQYAAFGCGNRNYRHYNKTVDDVVAGLTSRGASALLPTGKGDESTRATEEDFLEWKSSLFPALASQLSLTEHTVGYEPEVQVIERHLEGTDQSLEDRSPFVRGNSKRGLSEIIAVPIITRRIIATYKETDRTCVHLELDLAAHRQIKYKAGDHISIWPVNPENEIFSLLKILQLEAKKDIPVCVLQRDSSREPKVRSPTTPYILFQRYLEICAPVPRDTALFLADFAPTKRARTELKTLAQSKETYARFLEHNHVTFSRLLKYITRIDPCVTWASLPLSFVIDMLPKMKPRTYSISSSPAVSPRRVSITVSINPTRLAGKPDISIPGLASSFLSSRLSPVIANDEEKDQTSTEPWTVYAQVRTSTFRLPASIAVPIIMVAAGTGIAPFRAFLQERAHLAAVGREVGPMLLFFGCQDKSDFLYRDLISKLQSGHLAGKLHVATAYSRAQGKEKQYVGDLLVARSSEVSRLLTKEDAALYICGAASMARSVKNIIIDEVKTVEGWSDGEADDWVQEKKKARRWFEDAWS